MHGDQRPSWLQGTSEAISTTSWSPKTKTSKLPWQDRTRLDAHLLGNPHPPTNPPTIELMQLWFLHRDVSPTAIFVDNRSPPPLENNASIYTSSRSHSRSAPPFRADQRYRSTSACTYSTTKREPVWDAQCAPHYDTKTKVVTEPHRKWYEPSACPKPEPGTQESPVSLSSSRQ